MSLNKYLSTIYIPITYLDKLDIPTPQSSETILGKTTLTWIVMDKTKIIQKFMLNDIKKKLAEKSY